MNNSVFVFGRGSQYLVDCNSDFKVDLTDDEGGCMAWADGFLFIFQGNSVKVCDLDKKIIVDRQPLPRKTSW